MVEKKTELIRKTSAVLVSQLVANALVSLLPHDVPVGQMILGFDPSNPENERYYLAVDEDGSRDWTQHTTEPFLLHTWGAHKVESTDEETGEVSIFVRVVLIDPQGDTMTFGSKGIVQSLDRIRALRGDGPFDPPLPVIVHRIPLGGERQYLKLRMVANGKPPKSK